MRVSGAAHGEFHPLRPGGAREGARAGVPRRLLYAQADRPRHRALRQEVGRGGGGDHDRGDRRGPRAADRREPPTSSTTCWSCWRRAASRSPRSRPRLPSAPPSPASTRRPHGHGLAHDPESRNRFSDKIMRHATTLEWANSKTENTHGPARRHRALALPHLLARRMGVVARRHADDAAAGRDRPAALAQRPPRHRRGRGNLSAAVAAPLASTWRRPSACTRRSSASSAPRTPRCPTSSASAARSRSASRPRRACCRRCSRAGPTCPRSTSSPPTASSTRTPCSSAKA